MPWKNATTSNAVSADDIFECRKCGDCCRGYGGTYVTDKDIRAIAAHINIDPETFKEKYCVFSGSKPVLVQGENGYCVFWDTICTIHPVKPRMCRAWPFIESVLIDVTNWETMAALCPGIRTDFPSEIIKQCVKQKIAEDNDRNF